MDVILQQVYPGLGMEPLLDLTRARHQKYADMHNFEYLPLVSLGPVQYNPMMGGWAKVAYVLSALERLVDVVVWLDADTIIWDMDADLRGGAPTNIGAVKFYPPYSWGEHWNVGVLYFRNNNETLSFVSRWLAMYPGPEHGREQVVFNEIGQDLVTTLPSKWNYTLNRHFDNDAPIVKGFHGSGTNEQKLKLMKEALS
jgi:hypothetical protein